MADGIANKMANQEASFSKQEADRKEQVLFLYKQLEKLKKEVTNYKKKDARGLKTLQEAYDQLLDEMRDLERVYASAQEANSIASQYIHELERENQTLKAEVEGTRQDSLPTSLELQVSFDNTCSSLQEYLSNLCTTLMYHSSLVSIYIQYIIACTYMQYLYMHVHTSHTHTHTHTHARACTCTHTHRYAYTLYFVRCFYFRVLKISIMN